jgi:hypothetical protein
MSANSTGKFRVYDYNFQTNGNFSLEKNSGGTDASVIDGVINSSANYWMKLDVSHTHTLPASYIYGKTDNSTAFNTGAASGSTANSTAFNSGETQPTFTGKAATLTATQGGTISGGAYSFTGTAGTTGSKGDGGAHNNMPPYIVKYCWERVS